MEKGSDGPDLTLNLFLRFPDPVSFVNTPYILRLSASFRDPCSLYGGVRMSSVSVSGPVPPSCTERWRKPETDRNFLREACPLLRRIGVKDPDELSGCRGGACALVKREAGWRPKDYFAESR